ncbi:MAG: 6-carboxytetrahydropterin synthase QueD [Gammaproteobacteria bacterium]|nr:6-carboxytetrahydropterin synthase QueD [Gammaproteobacteria bacterium]MBU2249849.1 6-carboxytetrahydropterin synthase QueD [Gammaproteobacteria bacterium]
MKEIVYVTKVFEFHAAHWLKSHQGVCSRLHGHSYKLEVTCKGELNEEGMVVDFSELKEVVEKLIISQLDHECLNDILQFENDPTAERLAVFIFNTLRQFDVPFNVDEVKVWETSTSYATYRGEYYKSA